MEKKKKPEIRFEGFTDDWEQRKLKDVYGSIGNAFVGTATPYYVEHGHFYLESNNIKDGKINHNSEIFINDEFYEKQKEKWLHTGDIVMVQSGHVGHAAVIPEELDNTAAHALIMFKNPKEKIEPYFLNYEYQTDKAKKKIENITTGNTIKHILASDMQEFEVDVPKCKEQKVIASYFCKLDHLITLHQRKYEKLKNVKKSMLEKMFPSKGCKVPEIRFSGFTDDWEQRKLGIINTFFTDGNYGEAYPKASDMTDSSSGIPFLTGGNLKEGKLSLDGVSYITPEKHSQLISGHLLEDDIVIAVRGSLGALGYVNTDNSGWNINSQLAILRTDKSELYGKFLIQYLLSWAGQNELLKRQTGSALKQLPIGALKDVEVPITSVAEQERIATYFDSLDHLITLHQRELEKLKNIKKTLLEKMF